MIKSHLRNTVQNGFELLWSSCFRLVGRDLRCRLAGARAELEATERRAGDQRVLVVAPHPDDEVAGCAGALFEHRRCGDSVAVACVTDGSGSRAFGLGPEEMATRRRMEAGDATRALDVELEWLDLPDGQWPSEQLTRRLGALIERRRPHLVYAPSRVDFHPEHERVARALAAALGPEAPWHPRALRLYPVQVPLTPILASVLVPVAEPRQVERVLRCYETQFGSLRRCLRMRRYAACLGGVPGLAEEFWQLDCDQYRRLHREAPPRPLVETFRGLRYYAWSDPLAYLRGNRERRRLAEVPQSGVAPGDSPGAA